MITSQKNIQMPKLHLIGEGVITVDFPTRCSEAVLVSSAVVLPIGNVSYYFEGVDGAGVRFEYDTKKMATFENNGKYLLSYVGDSNVEVTKSEKKSLLFSIQNDNDYQSRFNFSISDVAGFSESVQPSSAIIPAKGVVNVKVDVEITSDSIPDKSSHDFTLTASNECKRLTVSTTVTVSSHRLFV